MSGMSTTQMIATGLLWPSGVPFGSYMNSLTTDTGGLTQWQMQEIDGIIARALNPAVDPGRELSPSAVGFTFTGDNPDGWITSGEIGTDPEVSEVGTGQSHGGVGTGACNLFSSATSTQPRITLSGAMAVGKTFQITTVISAITGTVRVTTPTVGFEFLYTTVDTHVENVTSDNADLLVQGRFASTNATIDSISIKQTEILASSAYSTPGDNPYDGTHTGTTVVAGAGGIQYTREYNGSTNYTDIYSAEKNSIWLPTDFSEGVFVEKATWDASERDFISFIVDANNYMRITDTTTPGIIQYDFMAGGTLESLQYDTGQTTNMFYADLTVTGGNLIATYNGVQVGITAVAGTFVGNLASAVLGARDTAPTNVHNGKLAYAAAGTLSSIPAAEKLDIYNRSGI